MTYYSKPQISESSKKILQDKAIRNSSVPASDDGPKDGVKTWARKPLEAEEHPFKP